ncbi:MAG: RdgB/HAM1 family non-canonical purine NTP pyrophosphatase [Gammaproteobacteria bacterium]|nr:RdgB/HAM1 family non-canonical purine NTP pyrophosphatase [Gammaproteobacteria bacterium]
MTKNIVLATGNAGKVREIQAVLADYDIEVLPQSQFDIPEAIEDGLTFVENALIKARHASKLTGLPAIADDSGIEVDFLNGQPGIYSSRYAGENGDNVANNTKLLGALKDVAKEHRTARFQCVIVYLRHELDPTPIICQGTWEGHITESASGTQGFGYDPLFFIAAQNCTAAELESETKNQISHRGQALKEFVKAFSSQNNL